MFSPLHRPSSGERILPSHQRGIVAAAMAGRNIEPAIAATLHSTGYGTRVGDQVHQQLMFGEIVDDWFQEGRAPPWPYGWHYTIVKPILYYQGDGDWKKADLSPVPDSSSSSSSEGDATLIPNKMVWHPRGYPPSLSQTMRDAGIFYPRFLKRDQIWCLLNQQSGRWEILDSYERVWRFELAEDLEMYSETPVTAYPRLPSTSAHGGYGGFVTDTGMTFLVADWSWLGYCGYGPASNTYAEYHSGGAYGVAQLHEFNEGAVGVIIDMECVPACKCTDCPTSSSSGA